MKINPLKQLRLSKSWSLDQVSESSGLSRQLIIRAEQGCYNDIPPAYLNWITDYFDVEENLLDIEYQAFRVRTRQSNAGLLSVALFRIKPEVNPLTYYRERYGLSMAAVYKGFCLHPATIHKLEKQTHLVKNLPPDFCRAVSDAGYPLSWTAHIQLWLDEHKEYIASKIVTRTVTETTIEETVEDVK